ncbi:MAG: CaiB/BaiF CoA transferase family protein [Burkholderiaceae bacterium]
MTATLSATLAGPLQGVRVLDLTRVLSGPFCTMIFADLGADVIKIEDCEGGDQTRSHYPFIDDLSHYFLAVNRNKRSVAVNLKHAAGRDLILRLAAQVDVLIENFRPGVMASLGLSIDELRQANSRLIVCSISGYGQTGSLRTAPAFDIITQALSGVMSINGEEGGGPLRLGIPLGDIGGGLWAAIGVLSALQHRHRTGEALHVDLSLLEALMAQLGYLSQLYFVTGASPGSAGNRHHTVSPYGCYEASDGSIVIAVLNQRFFESFCRTSGRLDLLGDARFCTPEQRSANRAELDAIVCEIIKGRARDEWVRAFEAADVPCAAVKSVGEALEQPIVRERGFIRTVDHPTAGPLPVVGNPLRFEGRFESERFERPPQQGEHTAQVLREAGLDDDEIGRLERSGTIRRWTTAA